jgi:hypothetical protein
MQMSHRRADALRVIGDVFAAAARPSKGGFVRDALSNAFLTACRISLLCIVYCRADALRVISDAFAAAARPSKGGFVRDALSSSYPRLVSLLEGAFARIQTESRLKVRKVF